MPEAARTHPPVALLSLKSSIRCVLEMLILLSLLTFGTIIPTAVVDLTDRLPHHGP